MCHGKRHAERLRPASGRTKMRPSDNPRPAVAVRPFPAGLGEWRDDGQVPARSAVGVPVTGSLPWVGRTEKREATFLIASVDEEFCYASG